VPPRLTPTVDPNIWIEEQRSGYVRYRRSDGRRWAVLGTCDKRAECVVGLVVDGHVVETLEEAKRLADVWTGPDVPVTPEFRTCCGDPVTGVFTYVELDPVGPAD
jgi:hypothetical protein